MKTIGAVVRAKRYRVKLLAMIGGFLLGMLAEGPAIAIPSVKAQPAAPRQILSETFATYPPLFLRDAKTLDPSDLAREAWKGYVDKKADVWAMTPEFKPMLRFAFDCRALFWPSIKHHPIDGLDNNGRGVGALERLDAMFGEEMENDPVQPEQMAYLLSCSDPVTGSACMNGQLTRTAPLAEGEMANNPILLYQVTGQKRWRDWAQGVTMYAMDEPDGVVIAYVRRYTAAPPRAFFPGPVTYWPDLLQPHTQTTNVIKCPTDRFGAYSIGVNYPGCTSWNSHRPKPTDIADPSDTVVSVSARSVKSKFPSII